MSDILEDSIVTRSLEMALAVDPYESRAYVDGLRARYPEMDRRQLADHMIQRARWWGAGFGFMTGMPQNPLITVQAVFTDMAALLRTEVILACRIGLLFDRHLLDANEPPYELLVPIMGTRAASEVARNALTIGGMELTRQALRSFLRAGGIKTFRRIMLKYFGIRVTQHGLMTRAVPLVGGLVGGGWNYMELKLVGERVYKYFEDSTLNADEREGELTSGSDVPAEGVELTSGSDVPAEGVELTSGSDVPAEGVELTSGSQAAAESPDDKTPE
jgi:hypothetical protein